MKKIIITVFSLCVLSSYAQQKQQLTYNPCCSTSDSIKPIERDLGEFEIIGYKEIKDEEYVFPISYGRSIDNRGVVFLQWGLIHKELPQETYCKYINTNETQSGQNPYGFYSIGFTPHYDRIDVLKTIGNKGIYDFDNTKHFKSNWDLRNPRNKIIREELFKVFGLDSSKSYFENSIITGTKLPSEIIKQLEFK